MHFFNSPETMAREIVYQSLGRLLAGPSTFSNIFSSGTMGPIELKGSLTLAMGKCLWFSVKIKVCQTPLSSP